ncbi:Neural-cadherin [Dufourea novaeangliae]|uniref:Neural-cadherin n=1 Tax=Dufourea novaeangliae TaxID=178035 RepID=A0A154PGR9_DUFNO|nr:Neural-cadherin [Dufourea novaeangliae]
MPGSTAQTNKFHTFYLQQRNEQSVTWADIKVNHPLDYESIKEYNLTIRVENNGAQQLASEATAYIVLEDVNDEIPLFTEREQETVLEGEPVGSKVTQVNAIDKDGTFPNNKVTYYVVDSDRNEGKNYFEINKDTGEIFTKVMFDREKQGAYALEVEARDGAASARPNSNAQPNSVELDLANTSTHCKDVSTYCQHEYKRLDAALGSAGAPHVPVSLPTFLSHRVPS